LPKLFSLFDRSPEVDEAVHKSLADHFRTTDTAASEEENELINEVLEYEEQDWKRIRGTVQEPVEYFQVLAKGKGMLGSIGKSKTNKIKTKSPVAPTSELPLGKVVRTIASNASDSPVGKAARTVTGTKSSVGADGEVEGAWGKAITNVDVSADRCLAYFWHHMAYESNAEFEKSNGRLMKMQVDVPGSHSTFMVTYMCFQEPTGDLVLVCEALPDSTKVDYGANLKVVRAETTGVYRFKPTNDDTQCEVTLIQHGDAGGFVPERVVVAKIPQALSGVGVMRELFQRDDAIDCAKRGELAGIIKSNNEIYTDTEDAVVDRVRDQLGEIPDSSFEKIESPDHLVHMEGFHKGGKNGIPRASTVLDEDICTCAAWTYQLMGRHFVKAFYADGGTERAVTTHNDHSFTGQLVMDFNIPTFSPREFVTRSVWRWESETVLLVVTESCLAEQYPVRPGIVRASVLTLEKFERLDPVGEVPQTRIAWMQQPDMGGLIPSQAVRGAAVGQMMYVSKMRKRFDKSPAIDAASSLRLVTMIEGHDGDYSARELEILEDGKKMLEVFEQQKSKELKMASHSTQAKMSFKDGQSHAYGWSTAIVRASPAQVLAYVWDVNKRASVYEDDLEKTLDEDGEHNKLLYIKKKKGETRVEARVRARMEKQKGLKELGQKHEWFEVLLTKVVANKLRPAGDSKAKLCNMSAKEARVIGGALASCIAANLTAPAAVDEWILRYPAMGELEREYVWFRPMMDTVAQRHLESVGWGLKMRLYTGAGLSTMDLLTDLYMIYTAATISFDFDVSPQRRRDEPDFYGYIPDAASSRTLIFGCMIINGALLLLARSVSMALLAMVGGQWVLVYLASDMGLYFMYKLLRRDLWHWIALEGAASVVESVLERLIVKVLVDFTGVIQFRGAGEMGASYFTFNMIMSLAASFVATRVYYASLEEDEEGVMDEPGTRG
ncbi:hypothetical protein TeGR_g13144, partial [Tetraparma gracilis]